MVASVGIALKFQARTVIVRLTAILKPLFFFMAFMDHFLGNSLLEVIQLSCLVGSLADVGADSIGSALVPELNC
jgi:hypothetical protein